MKIRFLGTGAADWDINNPSADINYRRYSSALIDRELLIDPGPCVFEAAETFGIDLSGVKYIINTHGHSDHYNPDTVKRFTAAGAQFIRFEAGETKSAGEYKIEAVRANHGTCENAVHFIISCDKRIFYALDGAWLLYDEIAALKKEKTDLAVLDATIGDVKGDYRIFEHNDLRMVEEMKYTMSNFVDRFIISHMARTLHTPHAELCERMKRSGIEVAYDGMELIV